MIDRLLQIVAPHYCFECGDVGALLCENCKYNITMEPMEACLVCLTPTGSDNVCQNCKTSYTRAWCVSLREGSIRQLIDAYKFERARSASKVLASLLDKSLPVLPEEAVVVAVPTIAKHIRQRGYDHTLLVAKQFAKLRRLRHAPLLSRQTNSVQRGVSKQQRLKQAKEAFRASKSVPHVPILLIDDVMTTGATLQYAAQTLMSAGAKEVWVAVVARQQFDK